MGRGRQLENSGYAEFVASVIRRLVVRVGRRGMVEDLGVFPMLQVELDAAMAASVAELRAQGVSWAQIGEALGVSRQAAFNRFGAQQGQQERAA